MEREISAQRTAGVNHPAFGAPDPFELLNVVRDGEAERARRPQPLWAQRRERRAGVLAATRRLIAERGQKQLTIRDIAAAAHVSAPTVYNLVGDRREVVVNAINDHTIALSHIASHSNVHPHFISALADAYARSVEKAPDFMREIIVNYFATDAATYNELHECGVKLLTNSVIWSQKLGLTRGNTSATTIARRCSAIITATIYEWARGSCGVEGLRFELVSASSAVLMAALTYPVASQLEDWMASYAADEALTAGCALRGSTL